MFGLGVLKGLGVTFKHFINTFIDDLKYFPSSTYNQEAFAQRQGPRGAGLFTVEYPEMKLNIPENFRFLPFLVTDYDVAKDDSAYERSQAIEEIRCTSCGICPKVCPPQCIWIVRTNDPETGKPVPQPAEFYIDTDICMNCGYCAEFCPFDAIKMDHDYELADYEREESHIHDLDRLLQPISYYASVRPLHYAQEEAERRAAEEEKRRKEEAKARRAAEKEAKAKAAKEAKAKKDSAKEDSDSKKRSPEEIKAQREAMMAKRRQKGAKKDGDEAEAKPKERSPEEIKAQREAMMAKRRQREAGGDDQPTPPDEAEAKPKERSPEEIKAQREAMMAKRQQREAGADQPPETKAEAKAKAQAAAATEADQAEKAEAKAEAASAEKPPAPDDLTKIEGIGPKISSVLQETGLITFAQLAAADVDELKGLMQEKKLRLADPTTWPEQAELAAAGKWDELEKLQGELKGGRRVSD